MKFTFSTRPTFYLILQCGYISVQDIHQPLRLNTCIILIYLFLFQSKTVVQAEIDAAAELVDFLRFNAFFAKELTKYQPISEDASVTKNSMRMRGLEGFVAAISPFNFTAIGGNLASAPALMV